MTYGEAVESALRILNLGTTPYAHEQYDDILLAYVNAAVLELSKDSRPVAEEEVSVEDGVFHFSDLDHAIYSLIEITDEDGNVLRTKADGDRVRFCHPFTGTATVLYAYFPDAVTSADMATTDIPLARQYHGLVPMYASGQYLLSDASDNVGITRGQAQMQLFQAQRAALHKVENGTTRSHKMLHRGW